MMRPLLIAALLLTLAPLAGAAAPTPDPSPTPEGHSEPASRAGEGGGEVRAPSYRIVAGDTLEITVLNQADLTKTVTVLPDGKIAYPYLGEIHVVGLTIGELTRRIAQGLNVQLVRPQVTVLVRQRFIEQKQVSVLGAVKSPGKHDIKEGWRVLDVIADCGGLTTERPEWVTARLYRSGGAEEIPLDMLRLLTTADPNSNPLVQADDVLLVQALDPARTQVQVLGEVAKPGPVPVPRDGSPIAVVMEAGGPTAKAALSRASILRGSQTIPVDLSGLRTDGRVDAAIHLQPGDTLVVPQNKLLFAVFGAVQSPGAQEYPEGETLTVSTALIRSGGQARDAELKNATLIRPAKDGQPTLVAINLEEMLRKGDFSKDVPVQPGDILFLPGKTERKGFGLRDAVSLLPFVHLLVR